MAIIFIHPATMPTETRPGSTGCEPVQASRWQSMFGGQRTEKERSQVIQLERSLSRLSRLSGANRGVVGGGYWGYPNVRAILCSATPSATAGKYPETRSAAFDEQGFGGDRSTMICHDDPKRTRHFGVHRPNDAPPSCAAERRDVESRAARRREPSGATPRAERREPSGADDPIRPHPQ